MHSVHLSLQVLSLSLCYGCCVQTHFPVSGPPTQRSVTITNEEASIIRYASGYSLRTVREIVKKGSHPLMEEMVLAIMEIVADEDENNDEQGPSTECQSC